MQYAGFITPMLHWVGWELDIYVLCKNLKALKWLHDCPWSGEGGKTVYENTHAVLSDVTQPII